MNVIFLNVGVLTLLALVPVFAGFFVWRQRIYRHAFQRLGDLDLIRRLVAVGFRRRYFWWNGLWLCALIALVIALARPVWGVNTDVIEVQGVSVVVVLDVSNSMLAQDLAPSRLQRARLALHDLFDGLRGNEVALVLFAGSAFAQFPLTNDIDTAMTFLNAVDTGVITQQGTVIEDALRIALGLFDMQRPAARFIVLATDGENHEGDVERVIGEAVERGVIIHTLGFGDAEGAPVPVLNESGEVVTYKADAAGQLVLSRLDETTLQKIAWETGGLYHQASANGAEITNLIHIINQAEAGLLDNRIEARSIERFGIFVLIAIIALTLEIMLPAVMRMRA
jgi:Ca-activated chloride channel family protein